MVIINVVLSVCMSKVVIIQLSLCMYLCSRSSSVVKCSLFLYEGVVVIIILKLCSDVLVICLISYGCIVVIYLVDICIVIIVRQCSWFRSVCVFLFNGGIVVLIGLVYSSGVVVIYYIYV